MDKSVGNKQSVGILNLPEDKRVLFNADRKPSTPNKASKSKSSLDPDL